MAVLDLTNPCSANLAQQAFDTMASMYRTVVLEYLQERRIHSISGLAEKAHCRHPEIMEEFIKRGSRIPSGKDLDNLLHEIRKKEEWLNRTPDIQVQDAGGNLQPADYPSKPDYPQFHSQAKYAIAKASWFYSEANTRFLSQNPWKQIQ